MVSGSERGIHEGCHFRARFSMLPDERNNVLTRRNCKKTIQHSRVTSHIFPQTISVGLKKVNDRAKEADHNITMNTCSWRLHAILAWQMQILRSFSAGWLQELCCTISFLNAMPALDRHAVAEGAAFRALRACFPSAPEGTTPFSSFGLLCKDLEEHGRT